MNEEEEHAIWYFSEAYDEEDVKQWKVIENLIDKQQKKIDKAIKYIEANTCDEEIYGNNDNGDYYQTIQCLSLRGGEIGKLLEILRGE